MQMRADNNENVKSQQQQQDVVSEKCRSSVLSRLHCQMWLSHCSNTERGGSKKKNNNNKQAYAPPRCQGLRWCRPLSGILDRILSACPAQYGEGTLGPGTPVDSRNGLWVNSLEICGEIIGCTWGRMGVLIGHAPANLARQMELFLKSSGFISRNTSGKEPVGGGGGGRDLDSELSVCHI